MLNTYPSIPFFTVTLSSTKLPRLVVSSTSLSPHFIQIKVYKSIDLLNQQQRRTKGTSSTLPCKMQVRIPWPCVRCTQILHRIGSGRSRNYDGRATHVLILSFWRVAAGRKLRCNQPKFRWSHLVPCTCQGLHWRTGVVIRTVAVAQLVEALRYKPEGRGFDSQWLNPSGRIVVLESTQPLTEMSTRNPSWG